ncbi:MAG TPA: MqnA/MqnD/SBP family protein [Gemmatimonadales bacterium]|jgi:1,4-dihydroxy-6-naphthoate synthase|nr:MqnA/MqnD/SBP family protein [Gemmatimonadales bacterium]
MTKTIHIAHSPDSDDAFMFYALAEGKLDTGELRYVHELADIETLNRQALAGELEVSAVSIHAYAHLADRYALLGSGASMGDGYGPRLVARTACPADPQTALRGRRVAVPGKLTTAYLALRLFQPSFDAVVVPFDQIEGAVAAGSVDAGLLIHEGQLTYSDQGFELWADLGAWWLAQTGLPLPLGGNVVRRDLGEHVMHQIARDLRASIEYGLEHRVPALAHARQFSRGLSEERTDAFVGMYVNHWTVDYGPRGRAAVQRLLDDGHRAGVIPKPVHVDFVD